MIREQTRPATARIAIGIIDFQPIGRGDTKAEIKLTDAAGNAVRQERAGGVIVVSREVDLEFSIPGHAGDRHRYLPIAIGFRSSGHDLLGAAAFPVRGFRLQGGTAQLVVRDKVPEENEFEYTLVIQRDDGAFGIIDPKIRNSPVLH